MSDQHRWQVDEDDDKVGKQRLVGRGDGAGFNGQRDSGKPIMLLLTLIVPIILLLIYALVFSR